jgi:hypothetical protein
MSATKAQINISAVQFNSVSITRVTACMFGRGTSLVKFKGDTDVYDSIIAAPTLQPHASITTADIGTVFGFTPGTSSTLTATLNDALLATGGAVVFTMTNAVFENADAQAQHAQFGTVTATWQAYASDGTTNPLSFTRT